MRGVVFSDGGNLPPIEMGGYEMGGYEMGGYVRRVFLFSVPPPWLVSSPATALILMR